MNTKIAGRWGRVAPGFNAAVADVVYDRIMKCDSDESANLYAAALLGAAYSHDLLTHGELIHKAATDVLLSRVEAMRTGLARTAVAKSRSGDTVAADAAVEILGTLISLSKAFGGQEYTTQARGERARKQHRDLISGKFVVDHHDVQLTGARKPIKDDLAAQIGIKPPPGGWDKVSSRRQSEYQQAYSQVAALLQPYGHLGNAGSLHLNYTDGTTELHGIPAQGAALPINPTKAVRSAAVSIVPPLYGEMSTGDALGVMGVPDAYNAVTNGVLNADRLGEYTTAIRSPEANDQFTPSRGLFRRMEHGSKLLSDSLGDAAPAKVRVALAVGQHIGSYGPEAQRVIGPTADKMAYRYRGIERAPDAATQAAYDGRTPGSMKVKRGQLGVDPKLRTSVRDTTRNPTIPDAAKREQLIHGTVDDYGDWQPSAFLLHLKGKLPTARLNSLHAKAGTIPPSEGVIFDKDGKMTVQAVGYADDHYLPFKLNNLTKLKGGEYVRTRTWGGPTTEDLYTGLMSGAKAMTVVSHNGSYTVEFDPTLEGKRRFNDKAARMVSRYGHLLDAVRNGNVTTTSIDPTRTAEIRGEVKDAGFDRDYDPKGFENEVTRRTNIEREAPRLSNAQRAEVVDTFLNEKATERATVTGSEQGVADVVRDIAAHRAGEDFAAYKTTLAYQGERGATVGDLPDINNMSPEDRRAAGTAWRAKLTAFDKVKLASMTQAHLDGLNDPDPVVAGRNVAEALGLGAQLDKRLSMAEEKNRTDLKELQLNGPGYEEALNALREQFPYYIKSVKYHPWNEGVPGGLDTGYVRPGRNRPQAALAGYFDTAAGGKVHADTTRYQINGNAIPAKVHTSTTVTAPSQTAAAAGRPVDPAAVARMQIDNDMAVVDAVRSARFGAAESMNVLSGDSAAAGHKELENHAVTDPKYTANIGSALPKVADLLHVTRDKLRADPQLHDKVTAAVSEISEKKPFTLPDNVLRAHRGAGAGSGGRSFEDPHAALDAADEDWGDLGNSAYTAGASTGHIANVYRGDRAINPAITANLLARTIDAPDFDDKLGALHSELRTRSSAITRYDAGLGGTRPPAGAATFKRDVEALVKAKQLRRRHSDATDAEVARAAEVEASRPINEVHNQLGFIEADDDQIAAMRNAIGGQAKT